MDVLDQDLPGGPESRQCVEAEERITNVAESRGLRQEHLKAGVFENVLVDFGTPECLCSPVWAHYAGYENS